MKFIAHRGIWENILDANSRVSLEKGLKSNRYIGIECDVRETQDHVFIIYHNVLYKGNLVKNTLYKDISNDVCKLEDILNINTNKIYLLEIKDYTIDKKRLLKVLNKYNLNIYLMSFNKNIIYELRKMTNKYKMGVLNYGLNSDYDYNLDFICLLDVLVTDYIIDYFKKKNIEVIIYGTIKPVHNLTYIIDNNKLL